METKIFIDGNYMDLEEIIYVQKLQYNRCTVYLKGGGMVHGVGIYERLTSALETYIKERKEALSEPQPDETLQAPELTYEPYI